MGIIVCYVIIRILISIIYVNEYVGKISVSRNRKPWQTLYKSSRVCVDSLHLTGYDTCAINSVWSLCVKG